MFGSEHKSSSSVAGTTVLFKVCTVRLEMLSLFFCVCFFMCCLCEKHYKPITVQYYTADCVSWVPRLTFLDLLTHSWNETSSYIGDLLYKT